MTARRVGSYGVGKFNLQVLLTVSNDLKDELAGRRFSHEFTLKPESARRLADELKEWADAAERDRWLRCKNCDPDDSDPWCGSHKCPNVPGAKPCDCCNGTVLRGAGGKPQPCPDCGVFRLEAGGDAK